FPLGRLQNLCQILDGRDCLFLVVGADVNIVVGDRIVRSDGTRGVERNESILPSTTAYHAENRFPPLRPVRFVGAIPRRKQEFVTGEELIIGEILYQPEVTPKLLKIHMDVLLGKHAPNISRQRMLFPASPRYILFHAL